MKKLCYNIKMRNNIIFFWGYSALFSGNYSKNVQFIPKKHSNITKTP